MAISRQKKEEIIQGLEEKFSRYTSAVFVDYSGLSVGDIHNIRKGLREEGVDMKVAKKTLLDLAMKKLKIDVDVSSLSGQIGVIFGYKDEVAPARLIGKFSKEFEALNIIGGIMDGAFVVSDKIMELAAIPSREILLGKMVGSIQAPVSGFVNVIQGSTRGLIQALNAIRQK